MSDTPGAVHCPRCQAVVVLDGVAAPASCFECGVEIPSGSNDLVPICGDCAPSRKTASMTESGDRGAPSVASDPVLADFPVAPDPEQFRAAGSLAYDESLELALRTSDSLSDLDVPRLSQSAAAGRTRKEQGATGAASLGVSTEADRPLHLSARASSDQGLELSLRSDAKRPALTPSLRGSGTRSAAPHPARASMTQSLGGSPSRLTSSPDSPPPEVIQFKRKTPLRDFFRGASRLLLILLILASAAAVLPALFPILPGALLLDEVFLGRLHFEYQVRLKAAEDIRLGIAGI